MTSKTKIDQKDLTPLAGLFPTGEIPIADILEGYLKGKSGKRYRFVNKLFVALAIVKAHPTLKNLLGVQWQSSSVFEVNLEKFAEVIGAKGAASLLHKGGKFTKNGFEEVENPKAAGDRTKVRFYRQKGFKPTVRRVKLAALGSGGKKVAEAETAAAAK
jgi:hypothetical protein